MSQLGSIFDGLPAGGDDVQGPDLRAEVRMPRAQLGHGPVVVRLPAELPTADGTLARRTQGPGEAADQVTLNLPRGTPDGATLRLRGQGARGQSGPPGDLFLKVWLVGPAGAGPGGVNTRDAAPRPAQRASNGSKDSKYAQSSAVSGSAGPLFGLLLGGGLLALLGWLATRTLG